MNSELEPESKQRVKKYFNKTKPTLLKLMVIKDDSS